MSYTFWLLKGRTLLRQTLYMYVKGGVHDERKVTTWVLPIF